MSTELGNEYIFNGRHVADVPRRLRALEESYDPGTVGRLERLGVGAGWHCLEVGTGAGSVTRWLSHRAGPAGRVLAADLDTSFFTGEGLDNVEVRQLDLRSERPPEGEFDLVHARLVLGHLPERDRVLDALVAALRPGGWLLVEEAEEFPFHGMGDGLHREVVLAALAAMETAGFTAKWGRKLPALFRARGLEDVSAVVEAPIVPGGSSGLEWLRLSIDQLIRGGHPIQVHGRGGYEQWRRKSEDPDTWLVSLPLVAAQGRAARR
ncbi:class I SAM-dependent methyltransferase [Amycolatopsis sacchari]|uniref:class I SAM-dependent methyltransferase n=1 Tax=Amycolatopsis sacchari TaxID=115433 RepID=UPI003D73321F